MLKLIPSILISTLLLASTTAQAQDSRAGIPINYDEALVGDYMASLPDPLVMANGRPVRSEKQWQKVRRPEILAIFETQQFGKMPGKPSGVRYEVIEDEGFAGTAVRKQVRIFFGNGEYAPYADLLVYLPKGGNSASPLLLNLSFSPNNLCAFDDGIWPGRLWNKAKGVYVEVPTPESAGKECLNGQIESFLDAGIGFATVCYTDFQPDAPNTAMYGVRGLYLPKGSIEPEPDEWGAISAWAWGLSRVMDYFESDGDIDEHRIAVTGFSRLGKTALWAAAVDDRFAAVIPACSGEGGVGISRRNYGETVAHLTAAGRYPYWFAENYSNWADKVDDMPMDGHMLGALIAPRPMFLSAGDSDNWSDGKGDILSALEVTKVYEFLGAEGLAIDSMPRTGAPCYSRLGLVLHEGGHAVLPEDWACYLEFLKLWL